MSLDAFGDGGFACSTGKAASVASNDATVDVVLEACLKAIPTTALTSVLETTGRTTKGYLGSGFIRDVCTLEAFGNGRLGFGYAVN
jgi:hypothetical protein